MVASPIAGAPSADSAVADSSDAVADADRAFGLGRAFLNGEGVARDEARAAALFRKAAEQGHAKAQNNLGLMLIDGRGIPPHPVEGVEWLRKAAVQGVAAAQDNLGEVLSQGRGGLPKDLPAAETWFRKAATQGFAEAQRHLGELCYFGDDETHFARNLPEAAKWFRLAAEQGDPAAQNGLGVLCENGWGDIERSPEKAAAWFLRAAEKDDAKAQSNLGRLYTLGVGLPRNAAKAYQWLTLSAAHGEVTAQNLLADFRKGMTQEEIAEGERLAADFRAAKRK
jgi:TPR repeat protein